MKKSIPWILFAVAAAFAVYFFLKLLGAGISIDGARNGAENEKERAQAALHFVRAKWVGATSDELIKASAPLSASGQIVKNHGDVIEVGEMTFVITDGRVSEVKYFD